MTVCWSWLSVGYDCLLVMTVCWSWLSVGYDCLLIMTVCWLPSITLLGKWLSKILHPFQVRKEQRKDFSCQGCSPSPPPFTKTTCPILFLESLWWARNMATSDSKNYWLWGPWAHSFRAKDQQLVSLPGTPTFREGTILKPSALIGRGPDL